MSTITLLTKTRMRPSFARKRNRTAWLEYTVWKDFQGVGKERMGYLLWGPKLALRKDQAECARIAREQEKFAETVAQPQDRVFDEIEMR